MMTRPRQGVQCRMVLLVKFFRIFQIMFFCFVVAVIFGLIHDVEAMFHLAELLTKSDFFLKYE